MNQGIPFGQLLAKGHGFQKGHTTGGVDGPLKIAQKLGLSGTLSAGGR